MGKPRGIQWLEDQTGEPIGDMPEVEPTDVHLSVRIDRAMAGRLAGLAQQRGTSSSALVRDALERLLSDEGARAALDVNELADRVADEADELRRRLAG